MSVLPPDPYKVLSIAPDVQLSDIRAAHRKLVKLYHPDKIAPDASDDERREKEDEFKNVQKAYELLSDENERRKYDEKVRLQKKYNDLRRAAAGASAFASAHKRPAWDGAPTGGVRVHTVNPRPDTFTPKSPPRDSADQYQRSPKPTPDHIRADRVRPNISVKYTTSEPRHPRRTPSPSDEAAEARQRAVEDKERDLAKRERELKKKEKALKSEKRSSDNPTRTKEEKANRKSKEAYVEEPQRGSEEVFVSKSAAKAKSSSKPHKSHRKHDRSRSRSKTRAADKPIKKKESLGRTHLRAEVEEADDTDTGVDSGTDDVTRKLSSAMAYMSITPKHKAKTFHGEFPASKPCVPTPPPQAASAHPPPPPANIVNVDPSTRHGASPPNLHRSSTAPQGSFARPIPGSGEPQYTHYEASPNSGRTRSRLTQSYYPEEEEIPAEDHRASRPRRGSSNAYTPQAHSYRQQAYPVPVAEEYFPPPQYYPHGASGHSPKHAHIHSGFRHVAGTAPGPMPFKRVNTSPSYGYDDVQYAQVPHQGYSPGMAYSGGGMA
ncbi:Molecular chaperone DnaJ [Zalerion maritima]|uniref:Molecular chaperone DnaJ n=1 Tax=Zalerion maritima TaxID=339359 RepID=A0AAD5WNF9_9PEZI|nr:Molecular chaperone DnaJ [Zalerion maritima]